MTVKVIGAGLAGCEAAWQLAQRGIETELIEMKPLQKTEAHKSDGFAELVCSNSLRGASLTNAVGLLKEEMRLMGSLIMGCADATKVEAGGALAVDRELFSKAVTEKIKNHPNIKVKEQIVTEIPEGEVIVASGPLTYGELADDIAKRLGDESELHFYDAAAPIVSFDSIDMSKAYFGARYGKGEPSYINCPMDKEQYQAFVKELINAEEAPVKGFEDSKVFEGCMPIEVMARRGEDTLRFGPMKPVGLPDPVTGKEHYAVLQLRKENEQGTMYNLVGFQTHLKFPEQKRVFSMIGGLENAVFLRYGVMHRNTFIKSPGRLDEFYSLIGEERITFAGQMTGVEGYVESAASGLYAGINKALKILGKKPLKLGSDCAVGALAAYISGYKGGDFQPMNINFGLIDSLPFRVKSKQERYAITAERALAAIKLAKIKGGF